MRLSIFVVTAILIAVSFAFALDFKAFNLDGLTTSSPDTKAIEKYGQPEKKDKAELEPATGDWLSKYEWSSKGIAIIMAGKSEKAKSWGIRDMTVRSPFTGKTDKGIGIGSDAAEVTKVYGKATSLKKDEIEYSEGDCCTIVSFTLKNGKVEKIWVGPTPE